MGTYKIETTITKDGIISLPKTLKKVFNHRVEVIVKDKETNPPQKLEIPAYQCGGKLENFTREELYESRL